MEIESEASGVQTIETLSRPRFAGYAAIVGPLVSLLGIGISIAFSPWFNWFANALSDLGHPANPAAPIFNGGLIVSGVILVLFAIFLILQMVRQRGYIGIIGAGTMLLSSICLMGVGLFNETISPYHTFFAISYFLLLTATSILIGIQLILLSETKLIGVVALISGLLNVALLAGGFIAIITYFSIPITDFAIPEIVLALIGDLWIFMIGYHLVKKQKLS